ncbi:hypothetical protein X732_23545 [Mesorhizobium sp. L2C066B000]|nr:hypothetical protein X732_23545 [Mesorhizobium sp. L2C066B000]
MGVNNWESLFPQSADWTHEYLRFFSLAVELICIEKALTAAHTLRIEGRLQLEASQELLLVTSVTDEFPALSNFSDRPPKTFAELSRACRQIVRAMNEASGRGTLSTAIESLPVREPAELLTFVVSKLSGIARLRKTVGSVSPGFKFCLDDCEVLSEIQIKAINTLVRKSRFPISWVICSVGEAFDLYETFIPRQPLTDADRRVISLDDRAPGEFSDLCQAVSSLRIFYTIPEESRPQVSPRQIQRFFSLPERLGVSNVNSIIGQMINRSTSGLALQIQEAAYILRYEINKKAKRFAAKYPEDSPNIPYYEAYLLWHWDGLEDSFSSNADADDMSRISRHTRLINQPSFQAWMRRKMVATLLQIAARLGFRRLPLSGSNIVVSLADGSIRDFLEIMGDIYEKYASDRSSAGDAGTSVAEKFATSRTRISLKVQSDGIYSSSEAFFRGISIHADARPDAVARLIEGLGELTHVLQTSANDPAVLSVAERGVFTIDPAVAEGVGDLAGVATATLYRAELAGYLRTSTVSRKAQTSENIGKIPLVGYRLHKRFAPYFHFSYRGAYEIVRIKEAAIDSLLTNFETSPTNWAKNSALRIAVAKSDQLSLFDETRLIDE